MTLKGDICKTCCYGILSGEMCAAYVVLVCRLRQTSYAHTVTMTILLRCVLTGVRVKISNAGKQEDLASSRDCR